MTDPVSYASRVTSGEMPRLCKVLTVGTVTIDTAITTDNKEEFKNISDELVLEHINNVIAYIQSKAPNLSCTPIADSPTQTWPLNGFRDIVDAGVELDKWWWAAHNREEPETHSHDDEDAS